MSDDPSQFQFKLPPAGTEYELRFRGRLTEPMLAWFKDMTVEFDQDSTPPQTVIRGPIRDQAALYGYVNRIRDLGLVLLSVNLVDTQEDS